MLTLRTPITLTADPSMLGIKDNFGERLMGNYQMIASGLEPEDMIHLAAQAPEVYLADEGMTSLVNMKNTFRNQNLKMEVVNNVLNRILVSDTYHMTYQDQVYISSMLQKMGVTDVKEFISQVRNFKQETKNLHQLIELYWGGSEALLEMREYQKIQEAEKGREAGEENKKTEQPYWLHQEIFNRLKTGAIYQEIRNYISESYDSFSTVHAQEMQISEQSFHAENILLNKLKNQTSIQEQPLIYNRLNTYEMGDVNEVTTAKQGAVNEYIEAVLLNTINQLYTMRYFQLTQNKDMWYRLEGVIYQAAANTLERFEDYHTRQLVSREEQNEYEKTVRENQTHEIETLQQFFKEYTDSKNRYELRTRSEYAQMVYEQQPEEDEWQQEPEGDIYQTISDRLEQIENYHDSRILNREEQREYENTIRDESRTREIETLQQTFKERQDSSKEYELRSETEHTQMVYEQQPEEEEWQQEPENNIYQTISDRLEQIENHHDSRILSREEQREYENTIRDESKTREIENLQQTFKEYQDSSREYELRSETEHTQMVYGQQPGEEEQAQQSEETKAQTPAEQIYHNEFVSQQIENVTNEQVSLKEQLDYINQQNVIKQQKLKQLEQIKQTPRIKQIDKKKAREDALRTLTEPKEVLLEYLNTETATETKISQRREQLEQVFDKETLQIFDTLEKYQKTPELAIQSGEVTPDSEGLLLRDIALNETEDILREQVQKEVHQTETSQLEKNYMQQQEFVQENIENLTQIQDQNLTELELIQRQNETNLSEEQIEELENINKLIRDSHKRSEYTRQRNTENEYQRRLLQEQNRSMVELVHKQNETAVDEEMLEEIRNMNRSTVTNTVQQEEHETETNVIREIVNSRVNEMQVQQNEDIERIISQNVRQQIGSISDQVYGKIEKRMDSERRRHGL